MSNPKVEYFDQWRVGWFDGKDWHYYHFVFRENAEIGHEMSQEYGYLSTLMPIRAKRGWIRRMLIKLVS